MPARLVQVVFGFLIGSSTALAGCFDPTYTEGRPCAASRECPGSLVCSPDNRCVSELDEELPASCTNGTKDGGETDVDCGGECAPCSSGGACDGDDDCASGACDGNACVAAASCLEILAVSSEEVPANGVFELTVGDEPLEAYCDFAGGGWTLVAKMTAGGRSFHYDSVLWTTPELLNDASPSPNVGGDMFEAKYLTFNRVVGGEMRLEFSIPAHNIHVPLPQPRTALETFEGPPIAVVNFRAADLNECANPLAALPDFDDSKMRVGLGSQFAGINGEVIAGTRMNALRIGYGSNDEPDSGWAARFAVGIEATSVRFAPHNDCDNGGCGCAGTALEVNGDTANLWIR